MTRQNKQLRTGHDKTRQGKTRQNTTRQDKDAKAIDDTTKEKGIRKQGHPR